MNRTVSKHHVDVARSNGRWTRTMNSVLQASARIEASRDAMLRSTLVIDLPKPEAPQPAGSPSG